MDLDFIDPPRSKAKTAYGLLRDVRKAILEEPARLDMTTVCTRGESVRTTYAKVPACGTVGCIAGWALVLTGNTKPDEMNLGSTWQATRMLGLGSAEAEELFCPAALCGVSQEHTQTPLHARQTLRHLDRFIAKYRSRLQRIRLT